MADSTYNAMVVLQSCRVSSEALPRLSGDVCVTSSNDVYGAISTKVEEGTDIDIKEDEIPETVSLEAGQDEVSYMSVRPLADIFPQYEGMHALFVNSISQSFHIKQLYSWQWGCVSLLASLGVFAKLQTATVNFVMSVHVSA